MENPVEKRMSTVNRRSFLRTGLVAGGAATAAAIGGGVLASAVPARAQSYGRRGRLNSGDAAILRFLAAAELIETDLWIQYAELGGVAAPGNGYQTALENLDGDGPQYITSNTLDEQSHADFINAYLSWRGAEPVNLDAFRTLPGSTAAGSSGKKRLTNLMHLNVDTSWYTRYRSAQNPDFGATFPQAIKLSNVKAIPATDADTTNADHAQVIANTAAFHFGFIEQGGSSLYAVMSQKVTDPEVLAITLGIGGDEIAHFLEWVDFAGNGVQPPVAPVTDPNTKLTFPDFTNPPNPSLQPNLIFPVPCEFISPQLPKVAIIRPLTDRFGGAVAAAESLTADGLFDGQSNKFLQTLSELAMEADEAFRR